MLPPAPATRYVVIMTISIGTIDLDAYLGVGIFLIVLTAILIVMRCASSLKLSKKLLIDDCGWIL